MASLQLASSSPTGRTARTAEPDSCSCTSLSSALVAACGPPAQAKAAAIRSAPAFYSWPGAPRPAGGLDAALRRVVGFLHLLPLRAGQPPVDPGQTVRRRREHPKRALSG